VEFVGMFVILLGVAVLGFVLVYQIYVTVGLVGIIVG
jgi:hypothetical protein